MNKHKQKIDALLLRSIICLFTQDDIDYWVDELGWVHGEDDQCVKRFKELLVELHMVEGL